MIGINSGVTVNMVTQQISCPHTPGKLTEMRFFNKFT